MGALWAGIKSYRKDMQSKVTFAFGHDSEYRCCDMIIEGGVFEVKRLLTSSIIQPQIQSIAIDSIAKGCLIQSLALSEKIKNVLLINMLPFPMCFMLKDGDHIIKFFDVVSENAIPLRKTEKAIIVDGTQKLSFFIGNNEIIEDIIHECNTTTNIMDASIEIRSNMETLISISTGNQSYKINIGELIG